MDQGVVGGLRNKLYALISIIVFLAAVAKPVYSKQVGGGLSEDFYDVVCPDLMKIVREAMNITADNDPVNLPALLRLFAHDAFVNGVDGSVLLESKAGAKTPADKAEKDAPSNLSLFGFDAVEFVKTKVEDACPGVVSCTDILTLTAQIAVELTGGPVYQSLLGRRDGNVSRYMDAVAQLPSENMTFDQLSANFASKGLKHEDLVALSGAHSIGFAHCSSFADRIYSFNATAPMDPSLDWTLGDQLQDVCQKEFDPDTVQALDISTIELFDENFYFNLQLGEGLLASDQVLQTSSYTQDLVNTFANDKQAFFDAFVASMHKFGSLGVLTGEQGEIRKICDRVNESPSPPPPPQPHPTTPPPPPTASPPPPAKR